MAGLDAEVNGIAPDDYKDIPLPEDYEIVELLSNVISVEYVDVASDGKSIMRNGIIIVAHKSNGSSGDEASGRCWGR